MQLEGGMKATMKDLLSGRTDGRRARAKRVSADTASLAKHFGQYSSDLARQVSGSAADFAKHVGDYSADVARRIGPKRALIGVGIIGAIVGGSIFLARFLRARAEEREGYEDIDELEELEATEGPETRAGKRTRRMSRARRKAPYTMSY
jgi:hypothetical protein